MNDILEDLREALHYLGHKSKKVPDIISLKDIKDSLVKIKKYSLSKEIDTFLIKCNDEKLEEILSFIVLFTEKLNEYLKNKDNEDYINDLRNDEVELEHLVRDIEYLSKNEK